MLAVAVCSSSLLFSSGVLAAVQKDKEQGSDSVHTWGPWNGVQTAAGPGTPGNLPLSLQFADAQNTAEGSDFEAGFTGEGEAREYHVYRKRGKYEQAFFDSLVVTDKADNKKDQVKFKVTTESGKTINVGMRQRQAVEDSYVEFIKERKAFIQLAVLNSDNSTAFYMGYWDKQQNNGVWKTADFVYGESSPITAVLALPQGIENSPALANYSGYFLNDRGSVDITIDFSGSGSWTGQFDLAGHDFNVANGAISGVDLSGSAVGESVVSGKVEASFFGSQAQYINGIADVDFGEEQVMDVFISSNQGELPVIEVPSTDFPQ